MTEKHANLAFETPDGPAHRRSPTCGKAFPWIVALVCVAALTAVGVFEWHRYTTARAAVRMVMVDLQNHPLGAFAHVQDVSYLGCADAYPYVFSIRYYDSVSETDENILLVYFGASHTVQMSCARDGANWLPRQLFVTQGHDRPDLLVVEADEEGHFPGWLEIRPEHWQTGGNVQVFDTNYDGQFDLKFVWDKKGGVQAFAPAEEVRWKLRPEGEASEELDQP